jgi:parvulin-like peptidyl-prolyl isomerase
MTHRIPRRPVFRTALRVAAGALFVSWMAPGLAATGGGAKLPVIGGKETVASVNGEPITLDDLLRQVGSFHSRVAEAKVRKPDVSALLDRIVNARLILQEARRIGLDQIPEFKSQVDSVRLNLVKSLLVRRQVEGITEGEPGAVERLYGEAVRELTIDSVLFRRQDDATAFSAAIKAGGDFKALAGKAVGAGKAQGGAGERSIKPADLRPEIAQAVTALKPGEASAPIKVNDGFTIVRLLEVRYPENPEARRQAQQDALEARKQARLEEYMNVLRTRYTSVNRRLFAVLDYESKEPGLEKLRQDERVVAQVKGGTPVRVKDLTAGVEAKFYHGVEGAIERKRVNGDLPQILDRILLERATALEAKRLDLERTDDFTNALKEQTDGALFDAFVKRVINPEVKLDSADLKTYYDEHAGDYATPEMMRIESLAFRRNQDAQSALDRLRKGADLKWMRENAGGQVAPESSPSLLEFKGELMTTATLPEGVRKAVTGARAGDFRYYGEPGGPFYVLCVRQVAAATPQPYDSVKSDIATKMFVLSRQRRVDDWAVKLRAVSDIKIFATGKTLDDLLGLGPHGGA